MVKQSISICTFSVIAYMIAFTLTIYYVSDPTTKLKKHIRQKFGSSVISSYPFQATHSDHPYHYDGIYHRLYPVNCSAVFHGNETHLAEIRVMLKEQLRLSNKTLVPSDSEVSRIIPTMLFFRYAHVLLQPQWRPILLCVGSNIFY